MYLASLAELALGSRLKALSDQFYSVADEVYRTQDTPIESRWFPVLRYLWEQGPSGVTEIAQAIGQTHSAVSQLADRLTKEGLLERHADPHDGRRSVLALSDRAQLALSRLGPLWTAITDGVREQLGPAGDALLQALADCERAMQAAPLRERILERHLALRAQPVEIVPYTPALAPHFARLNAAWLQRYFRLEPIDEQILGDPQRQVLDPGGAVWFARLGEQVIGTCALLCEAPGVFELSKMAVDEAFHGLGVGRRLLQTAIAAYHQRGGHELFLESSSRLKPALRMYAQAGFVLQPALRAGSHYDRADVYMIYQPAGEPLAGA